LFYLFICYLFHEDIMKRKKVSYETRRRQRRVQRRRKEALSLRELEERIDFLFELKEKRQEYLKKKEKERLRITSIYNTLRNGEVRGKFFMPTLQEKLHSYLK